MFGPGALGYLAQNDGLEEVGRFLVRRDPGLTEAKGRFVVSVVFKGTVTHHLLEQAHPGATFTLNHSSTDDDITNLEKVVGYLYEEHANWPLKLSAAFFTSELSDGDGADGPPKIKRLGSVKLTKKEQASEGGELSGLLGARHVSPRTCLAMAMLPACIRTPLRRQHILIALLMTGDQSPPKPLPPPSPRLEATRLVRSDCLGCHNTGGFSHHRRNSIKAAAIKAEDEYAAVVKAATEAEAAEELAKNPVPDAASGDEDAEEGEEADDMEEDTGFGGDLADAAAEDEVSRLFYGCAYMLRLSGR